MSISEELARLAELHQKGRLSDAEFQRAKQLLLSQSISPSGKSVTDKPAPPVQTAGRSLDFPTVTMIVGIVLALAIFLVFVVPNWRQADKLQNEFDRDFKKQQEEIDRQENKKSDNQPDPR